MEIKARIVKRHDVVAFARETLKFDPDPVQEELLQTESKRVILNCTRQWGKSTVTSIKAVHQALMHAGSLTLIVSPSVRQSAEFLMKCEERLRRAQVKCKRDGVNAHSLVLPNGSRIVALPNSEGTVRGFSAVALLLIDEAARVPDGLYEAVLPMLAVSDGALWLLSTPAGPEGFFYETWSAAREGWQRIRVPATECPRIPEKFLKEQRARTGDLTFRQEYLCEFVADEESIFGREELDALVAPGWRRFQSWPPWRTTQMWSPEPKLPGKAPNGLEDLGPWTQDRTWYHGGLDLGQARDSSALVVLAVDRFWGQRPHRVTHEHCSRLVRSVCHVERFALRTPYPEIVENVMQLLPKDATLAIDATGVGAAVTDLFRGKTLGRLMPVVLTSGESEGQAHGVYTVPKAHLASRLEVAVQQRSFWFGEQVAGREMLFDELCGLKKGFTARGQGHDDVAMALALAWWGAGKNPAPLGMRGPWM